MLASLNLNNFELPRVVEKDNDYIKDLENSLDKYFEHICKKIGGYKQIENSIKENIYLIKKSLENYYNGRLVDSYENIRQMLIKYTEENYSTPFIVATINENYAFRGNAPKGIRPAIYSKNNEEYNEMLRHELTFFKARIADETIEGKDMLHIPLNKRGLIGSQRFSIPGIPCIYLSTSSYGTWIEMGCPASVQFQVSSIRIPTDIRILNLCVQQYLIDGNNSIILNENDEKQAIACLEIFPLVIATSYQVKEQQRKFKSEYIISQIVMQVCKNIGIEGVAYLSRRTKDQYAYPHTVNLAIAISNSRESLYWERAKEVWITEPVRFIEFLSKGIRNEGIQQHFLSYVNEIYKNNNSNSIYIGNGPVEYINTDFSAFDEYILQQNFSNFLELQHRVKS